MTFETTTTGPRYVPFDLFDISLTKLKPGSEAYALAWLHQARKAEYFATHVLRRPDGTQEPVDPKAEARLDELWALAEKHGVAKTLKLPEPDAEGELLEGLDDPLLDQVIGVDPWLPPPREKVLDAESDLRAFAGQKGGLRALGEYAVSAHGGEVRAALEAFCAKYPCKADTLRQQVKAWQQELRDKKASESSQTGTSLKALLQRQVASVPWIIEDTAAPGAMLLVGRPKGGKSILTADMVFAVGNMGTFMGKQAKKCGVLWIAAEDDEDQLARRLQKRGATDIPEGVVVKTGDMLRRERDEWEEGSALDEWLDTYLQENPTIGLVIVDTQATAEAKWGGDSAGDAELRRSKSVVKAAYAGARVYQDLGMKHGVCIVLVHHSRKRNGKDVTDYHELINLPMTVVAGVTASVVIADVPEASPYEPSDQRVLAVRGRHMRDRTELVQLGENLSFTLLGDYHEIKQTEAQAEIMECIEGILAEAEQTSIAEVAEVLGKNRSTVKNTLRAMALTKRMTWKGRELQAKPGKGGGLRWKK